MPSEGPSVKVERDRTVVADGTRWRRIVRRYRAASASTRETWMFGAILVLGTLALLPAIRAPLTFDDYLQAAMLEGTYPAPRAGWNLYDFLRPEEQPVFRALGMVPWWADTDLTIRFFRPLASAMRWVEFACIGRAAWLPHLVSWGMWIATVASARKFFCRILPARTALVALAVFAWAPCHASPVAWLANRECLLALFFGIQALLASRMYCASGRMRYAWLASLAFALACASGEYGLAFAGYALVLGWAETSAWPRRLVAWASFVAPALVYLTIRQRLHYGARGTGFYTDPLHEPWAVISDAPRRLVTLLANGFFSLEPKLLAESTPVFEMVVMTLVVALAGYAVWFACSMQQPPARALLRGLLVGALLSLVPMLCVVPAPRLLGVALIGLAPAVAVLLNQSWFGEPAAATRPAEWLPIAAMLLGFFQLVHAPVNLWLVSMRMEESSTNFAKSAAALAQLVTSAGVPGKRSRLLKESEIYVARSDGSAFFLANALDERGAPPHRLVPLVEARHALLRRIDEITLDYVVPEGAGVFPRSQYNLFRSPRSLVFEGQQFRTATFTATVSEVGAAGPRRVRIVFDKSPEQADVFWATEEGGAVLLHELPAIGFGVPLD